MQWEFRSEAVVLFFEVAPADQIAEVVMAFALDESLVDHPVVVEHLGEVLGAVVADQGDDPLWLGLFAAVAQ